MLTILSLLCFVVPGYARPVAPLEGLEALRKAFSGTTDFTADITQEKRLSLMKRSMQMSGTVRFRKPDLFLMEIAAPYSSRMLLRDGTIEQVLGNGERNRIVLPPEQGLKLWLTRFSSPMTSLPDGMNVQADLTDGVYTLTIAPQGNGQVREVVVSFRENGIFRKLVIMERNGDLAAMTFHKVRRNIGMTEKDFKLE